MMLGKIEVYKFGNYSTLTQVFHNQGIFQRDNIYQVI